MSGLEAAGIAIGIVGLSTVLTTTVKQIRTTVQDIHYAQGDILEVEKEVDLFARIYDDFLDACDEASSMTRNASKIKTSLISWTEKKIKGFKHLLHKVQAVARDPEYYHSIRKVASAYHNWIRSKGTVRYLRASLSVARQSMVAFTNIRIIEKLNEELAHLRSPLSSTERESIELRLKMPVEERIRIIRKKRRNRHTQRRDIEKDLNEAIHELATHQENIKDTVAIPQTEPLLQFQGAVKRYVGNVYHQERSDRRAHRSQRGSSLPSSHSTASTPTRSTQSSNNRKSAPESPPTSPEPTPEDPRVRYYEEAFDRLERIVYKHVDTCTGAEAHLNSVQHTPSEAASHTSLVTPPIVPPPPPKPESKIRRGRASSCPQPSRKRLSSQSPMPHRRSPAEQDVSTAEDANTRTFIDPVIHEEAEDVSQDGTSEEGDLTEEQTRKAGPSIWQATGAFEGHMPRGLSRRRQRSQSPQDFW